MYKWLATGICMIMILNGCVTSPLNEYDSAKNKAMPSKVLDIIVKQPQVAAEEAEVAEIELQMVEIDNSVLPSIVDGDAFTIEIVSQALKNKKAKTIESYKLRSSDGNEVTTKGVIQWIYPDNDASASSTNVDQGKKKTEVTAGSIETEGLKAREVGTLIQLLPEILSSELINVVLTFEYVGKPEMMECLPGVKKPFFNTISAGPCFIMRNGETVIATAVPDRRKQNTTDILLMKARIITYKSNNSSQVIDASAPKPER